MSAICGGPEPHTMKACYAGCYEWCISRDCSKAPEELTEKDRRRIRRFQKACGGYYPDDLRRLQDFGISDRMLETLRMLVPTSGTANMVALPKSRARPLLRRDLAWEVEGQYHLTGAGAHVLSLAVSGGVGQ